MATNSRNTQRAVSFRGGLPFLEKATYLFFKFRKIPLITVSLSEALIEKNLLACPFFTILLVPYSLDLALFLFNTFLMYLIKFGDDKENDSGKPDKKKGKSDASSPKNNADKNSISLIAASLLLGAGFSPGKVQASDQVQLPRTIKIEQITLNRDENLEKLIVRNEDGNRKDKRSKSPTFLKGSNKQPSSIHPTKGAELAAALNKYRGLSMPISVNEVKLESENSLDQLLLSKLENKDSVSIILQSSSGFEGGVGFPFAALDSKVYYTVAINIDGESLVIPDLENEVINRLNKVETLLNSLNEKKLLIELILFVKAIIVGIIVGDIRDFISRRRKKKAFETEASVNANFTGYALNRAFWASPLPHLPLRDRQSSRLGIFASNERATWDPEFMVKPSQVVDRISFPVHEELKNLLSYVNQGFEKKSTQPGFTLSFLEEQGFIALQEELSLLYFRLFNLFYSPKKSTLSETLYQKELKRLLMQFQTVLA